MTDWKALEDAEDHAYFMAEPMVSSTDAKVRPHPL